MSEFVMDPVLARIATPIADWALCRVTLMNDARYPWVMLVPMRPGVVELFDLSHADRAILVEEVARVGAALKRVSGAAKINVGALGNMVAQMHVHVVGRSPGDANWPGPVWNHGTAAPYAPGVAEALAEKLLKAF